MIICLYLEGFAATLLLAGALGLSLGASPVRSEEASLFDYVGANAEEFADAQTAVDSFKSKITADDLEGVAKLIGLDPARVAGADEIKGNFEAIRERASKLFKV